MTTAISRKMLRGAAMTCMPRHRSLSGLLSISMIISSGSATRLMMQNLIMRLCSLHLLKNSQRTTLRMYRDPRHIGKDRLTLMLRSGFKRRPRCNNRGGCLWSCRRFARTPCPSGIRRWVHCSYRRHCNNGWTRCRRRCQHSNNRGGQQYVEECG